jgi:methyl-accepting chemotaxis protein/carbonic anhydrase
MTRPAQHRVLIPLRARNAPTLCIARALSIVALLAALGGSARVARAGDGLSPEAAKSLELLREGNQRFAAGTPSATASRDAGAAPARPVALVLASADAQLPVDRALDRSGGELYVLRSAGNAATSEMIASAELGIAQSQVPLIVVLGNARCAVISEIIDEGEPTAVMRRLASVAEQIVPVIDSVKRKNPSAGPDELKRLAIEENVQASIARLLLKSPVLHARAASGRLSLRGGVFDPATGTIRWLGDHPSLATILRAKPVDLGAAERLPSMPAPSDAASRPPASTPAADARAAINPKPVAPEAPASTPEKNPAASSTPMQESNAGGASSLANGRGASESKVAAGGVFRAPSDAEPARPRIGPGASLPRPLTPAELAESTAPSLASADLSKGPPALPAMIWEVVAGLGFGVLMIGLMVSARLTRIKRANIAGLTAASKLALVLCFSTAALLGTAAIAGWGLSRDYPDQRLTRAQYEQGHAAIVAVDAVRDVQVAGVALTSASAAAGESAGQLVDRYNQAIATAQHRLTRLAGVDQPAVQSALAVIQKELEIHAQRAAKLAQLQGELVRQRATQVGPVGRRIDELTTELALTGALDSDDRAFLAGRDAAERFAAARLAAIGTPASAREAASTATALVEPLRALSKTAEGQRRREWAQEASDALEHWSSRVERTALLMQDIESTGTELATARARELEAAGRVLLATSPMPSAPRALPAARVWLPVGLLAVSALGLLVTLTVGAYWVRDLRRRSLQTMDAAAALASGDLTLAPLNSAARDELGDLSRSLDGVLSSVRGMVGDITLYTSDVTQHASEIASSAEHMSGSVSKVVRQAESAAGRAGEMGQAARNGGEVVARTVQGIKLVQEAFDASSASVEELGRRGTEIGQLLSVIHDIAHKTNLLALDAAIAAARSGPASEQIGRIASQMRQLAEEATNATEQATGAIKSVQEMTLVAVDRTRHGADQAKMGAELAGLAQQRLEYLFTSAGSMVELTSAVTNAGQEAGASASQSAAASAQLADKAQNLSRMIQRYRTAPMRAEPSAALKTNDGNP